MTEKKRNQIVEMWNRGKTISKISRELRLEPLEVAEVVNELYEYKRKTEDASAVRWML